MEILMPLFFWLSIIFIIGIIIINGISISGGFKISKNYAFDYLIFHQLRMFEDGIIFIDFECRFDKYRCDHNPKFTLGLWLLNHTIFEFEIYNINHLEEDLIDEDEESEKENEKVVYKIVSKEELTNS